MFQVETVSRQDVMEAVRLYGQDPTEERLAVIEKLVITHANPPRMHEEDARAMFGVRGMSGA